MEAWRFGSARAQILSGGAENESHHRECSAHRDSVESSSNGDGGCVPVTRRGNLVTIAGGIVSGTEVSSTPPDAYRSLGRGVEEST